MEGMMHRPILSTTMFSIAAFVLTLFFCNVILSLTGDLDLPMPKLWRKVKPEPVAVVKSTMLPLFGVLLPESGSS